MRRDLLLVLLLVLLPAMSFGQADKKPVTENPADAAKPQVKTEAVKGQKEKTQTKTKAQQGTAAAQAEKKNAQAQTDTAQTKTEAVPDQTEAAQAQKEDAQAQAEEPQADQDPKLTSVPGGKALGMSVLGNQEAPTSLVIVPWKSSEVGRATGISPMLDDSRQPVDKEVFMRELNYYEIRSEKKQ